MRVQAGLGVARFCPLAGVPTSTWYRHRARHQHGAAVKGPSPRPVSDRVVAVVLARSRTQTRMARAGSS
jgi:hypothetical protein